MPKRYPLTLGHFSDTPWAVTKEKLREIQSFILRKDVDLRAFDDHGGDEAQEAEYGVIKAAARPRATAAGDVMVINVFGVIAKRMDMMMAISGGTSIERLTADIREAVNNPGIKAIVLNIDSPGGSVFGVQELCTEILAAREKKHIVALANDMAASAAYWIASVCDEVVVTPSGLVGSIGVYSIHEDWSKAYEEAGISSTIIQAGKFKTDGTHLLPLSETGREDMQQRVDFYYEEFIKGVAKGRGIPVGKVKSDFGQGRVLNAPDAKDVGMVDRIGTLDDVLIKLGAGGGSRIGAGARAEGKHHSIASKELELHSL